MRFVRVFPTKRLSACVRIEKLAADPNLAYSIRMIGPTEWLDEQMQPYRGAFEQDGREC
jgi:hypothetical protein